MSSTASQTVPRRILWVMVLMTLVLAACGGDDAEGSNGEATTTSEGAADANAAPDTTDQAMVASTAAPTTTTTISRRSLGVVLLAPGESNNKLNVRGGPGTKNPVVGELAPAQAELVATGAVEVDEGRIWHEVRTADFQGWAYSYYLTEILTASEVEQEWEWSSALDRFATALVLGAGLADSVSWRGLFAIYFDDNLRRWTPEELRTLASDDTDLKWSNTGASASEGSATVGSWKEVISDAFLSDYLDEDVTIEVGALPLGSNAVLPGSAISSAFANFSWVAIHDPGDDENLGGLDWSTWLVFLEMEEDGPKVVGLQPQFGYP